MPAFGFDELATVLERIPRSRFVSRITEIQANHIQIQSGGKSLALGDQVGFIGSEKALSGEVIGVTPNGARIVVEGDASQLCIGDAAIHMGRFKIAPNEKWIGRVVDPWGHPIDGAPLPLGAEEVPLHSPPPIAANRRGLGSRLKTGLHALNTLLPIARGQRLGLFAGSGVGKSNLIGSLATSLEADVVVVALVGERGREVGDFVKQILGKKGMQKSIVVAATSDQAALTRRRAAFTAMAVAEHFRDAGLHVLLVVDSVTRLAEAHREISSAAGEVPAMRGHPPSVVPLLASLSERAGPGLASQGDITAIFSVLVAGSDMEEPIADTLRGLLDGHIVLSREIAERGRFPAFDVLRSVSRALPNAATEDENRLISKTKALLSLYEETETLVRSGLYQRGAKPDVDMAVDAFHDLDHFIAGRSQQDVSDSFDQLAKIMAFGASSASANDLEGSPLDQKLD